MCLYSTSTHFRKQMKIFFPYSFIHFYEDGSGKSIRCAQNGRMGLKLRLNLFLIMLTHKVNKLIFLLCDQGYRESGMTQGQPQYARFHK